MKLSYSNTTELKLEHCRKAFARITLTTLPIVILFVVPSTPVQPTLMISTVLPPKNDVLIFRLYAEEGR